MMNASKLGTSELPGWKGAVKNLFKEHSSITAWATHQFASPIHYCHGSNSKSQSGCSWADVRTMNASKLGISELPAWRGAVKNLIKEHSSITAWTTHQLASPVYYCYGYYTKSYMLMLLAGCSNDERLKAWHCWTTWEKRSCLKFVTRAFVDHSLSQTPVCFFSILLL